MSDFLQVSRANAEVKWYKGRAILRNCEKYEIIAEGSKRKLIIKQCTFDDEKKYTCDAEDSRTSARLTVQRELVMCIDPCRTSAFAPQLVVVRTQKYLRNELFCTAYGHLQWQIVPLFRCIKRLAVVSYCLIGLIDSFSVLMFCQFTELLAKIYS